MMERLGAAALWGWSNQVDQSASLSLVAQGLLLAVACASAAWVAIRWRQLIGGREIALGRALAALGACLLLPAVGGLMVNSIGHWGALAAILAGAGIAGWIASSVALGPLAGLLAALSAGTAALGGSAGERDLMRGWEALLAGALPVLVAPALQGLVRVVERSVRSRIPDQEVPFPAELHRLIQANPRGRCPFCRQSVWTRKPARRVTALRCPACSQTLHAFCLVVNDWECPECGGAIVRRAS